jgi:malonyl-CoA O-methyltransferase
MKQAIDKEKVKKRFGRSIFSYNEEALVQKSIARELMLKITDIEKATYPRVLEIGCGTGFLTRELLQCYRPQYYVINDLVDTMQGEVEQIARIHEFTRWSFIPGDAEKLIFPGTFDLVVSASTIQWFQDTAVFFHSISRSMSRGSILAFSTFGTDNFKEIRTLHSAYLNYPLPEELISWLSPTFHVLHCSEKIVSRCFETPRDVLRHIRHTGVNAVENRSWNKRTLLNLEMNYRNFYSNPDGTVNLTYHPIIIIAQKK